jgi:hypothetical protein
MCDPEERSFFVDQAQLRRIWPDMWDGGYWKSQETIFVYFKRRRMQLYLGNRALITQNDHLVMRIPEKIRQFNPDARFT